MATSDLYPPNVWSKLLTMILYSVLPPMIDDYKVPLFLLVFHRKDLCEAKHKTASVFQKGICTPTLIVPTATEANYTRSVSHIGQCRHTQGRCTPCQSN